MAVLIKDMNLPKRCRECPFGYKVTLLGASYCLVTGDDLTHSFYIERSKNCPLIEVHGSFKKEEE